MKEFVPSNADLGPLYVEEGKRALRRGLAKAAAGERKLAEAHASLPSRKESASNDNDSPQR